MVISLLVIRGNSVELDVGVRLQVVFMGEKVAPILCVFQLVGG